MMRNGWTGHLRRRWRSWRDGCWRSRWCCCSLPASRATRSRVCPSWCSRGSGMPMHAPFWPRWFPVGWTSESPTRSSLRRAETRWRCSSYPEGSARPGWPAASDCPARRRCPDGSRRASCGGLRHCRRTPGGCCSWPQRSQPATRRSCGGPPRGTPSELRVLEPAESAGLIDVDSRVRFRHPLVRSALYRAAAPRERRLVHRALAEATDAQVDPDRRAWHLAAATAGPDELVASELERAADRAQARGGLAAAAAFQERAVGLTPIRRSARDVPSPRCRKYEAGALEDSLALLDIAAAGTHRAGRARESRPPAGADRLRVQTRQRRPLLLLEAARELERIDPKLARATYLDALTAARFAGPLAAGADLVKVSEAALAGSPLPQSPGPSDLLLQGLAVQITRGYTPGAPLLKAAMGAFEREPALPSGEGRWLPLILWTAADLWDDDTWRRLTTQGVERARALGALTAIPFALSMLSYIHATSGDLAAAEQLLDEIRAASEATSTPAQPYLPLWIAAVRGREAETRDLVQTTSEEAATRGEGFATFVIEHVTAVLYNGLGRYGEAVSALRRQAIDPSYRDSSPRPMAELIEAAVRSGERDLARLALDRVEETTSAAGTNWALGIQARSRALLSDGEAADGLYREAIERLSRTSIRVQLARAHLLYGEWLRRERRRRDAREHLRTALEMFATMGTEVRGPKPARASGDRRTHAQAHCRDPRRSHSPRGADRATGGRQPLERRDRRTGLPQPKHCRLPPPQRVRQAQHSLAPPTRTGHARRLKCPADATQDLGHRRHRRAP